MACLQYILTFFVWFKIQINIHFLLEITIFKQKKWTTTSKKLKVLTISGDINTCSLCKGHSFSGILYWEKHILSINLNKYFSHFRKILKKWQASHLSDWQRFTWGERSMLTSPSSARTKPSQYIPLFFAACEFCLCLSPCFCFCICLRVFQRCCVSNDSHELIQYYNLVTFHF